LKVLPLCIEVSNHCGSHHRIRIDLIHIYIVFRLCSQYFCAWHLMTIVTAEHGSMSGPAYLYSNGGPGVPYALPNGIALYCSTDGNSYLVPAAQQQVCMILWVVKCGQLTCTKSHCESFQVVSCTGANNHIKQPRENTKKTYKLILIQRNWHWLRIHCQKQTHKTPSVIK